MRTKCQSRAHRKGRVRTKDEQDDLWRSLGVVNGGYEQRLLLGFILLLTVKKWGSAGRISSDTACKDD